mgnify:CR=1 FL=1
MRVANILKAAVAVIALGTLVQCVETSVERSEREPSTNRYGSYLAGRYAASERDAVRIARGIANYGHQQVRELSGVETEKSLVLVTRDNIVLMEKE